MKTGTRAGIAKWAECERTVGFAEAGGKGLKGFTDEPGSILFNIPINAMGKWEYNYKIGPKLRG